MTISPDELRALARTTRGAKYGNRRGTYVAELDRRFDSQHEAEVAVGLWRRQQAGEIVDIRYQQRYPLDVDGVRVGVYVADFVYIERTEPEWTTVVADAKGFPTPVYKLKKKLMKACLGLTVEEL